MNDTPENAAPDTTQEPEAPAQDPEVSEGPGDPHHLRLLEAVLFSTDEPLTEEAIAERLPDGAAVPALLAELVSHYENHGVNLVRAGGRWLFRTAEDLSEELRVHKTVPRRLSRAAMETLAIIAYHQPVTRAEIEEIRGVATSKGTLDILLETGWVRLRGRRRAPGRPVTFGTTAEFLHHFGLEGIGDLPGLEELKGSGLLEGTPPPGFKVPLPSDDEALTDDEDPLEDDEEETAEV